MRGPLRRSCSHSLVRRTDRAVVPLILLVCLVAALAGCSQPLGKSQTHAEEPVSHLSRMEETGRRLYISVCAFCHGVEGDGFGINASNVPVPPRDHTDSTYMGNLTDEQLVAVIKFGGPASGKSAFMPSWGGRFSDREVAALAAYLRTLGRPKLKSPQ